MNLTEKHRTEVTELINRYLNSEGLIQPGYSLLVTLEVQKQPSVVVTQKAEDIDALLASPAIGEEISWSTRIKNMLTMADVRTLGMLVRMPEWEIRKYRNIGRKALYEIKEKLGERGLTIGMQIKAGPKERAVILNADPGILRPFVGHSDTNAVCAMGSSVGHIVGMTTEQMRNGIREHFVNAHEKHDRERADDYTNTTLKVLLESLTQLGLR